MTFKERLYICKSGHQQRSWQWERVRSLKCNVKGCRLRAHLAFGSPTSFAQNANPFVYYERPTDGEIFLAATHADTRHPRGFVRKEIRTMNDYNSFRRSRNERTRASAEIHREFDKIDRSEQARQSREALQQMIASGYVDDDGTRRELSPEGVALAHAAIERSYNDAPPNINVDSFLGGVENDRSNREPYNDAASGYRRRD
jgi:hypothetical protein